MSKDQVKTADAVSFDRGVTWKAVVHGKVQRPDFNARGPALIFAQGVVRGIRKAEPVGGQK